jgi:streptomycin 6-kinase
MQRLTANLRAAWGAKGVAWLDDLPNVLSTIARDWELTLGEPFDLSFHYVAAAVTADGTPVVLKLGVPGGGSIASEAAALGAFDGHGAVRLLRADIGRTALLLERAEPGDRAADLVPREDAEATSAAVTVMRTLHTVPVPVVTDIPDLAQQAGAFDEYLVRFPDGGPLPRDLVGLAGGLMRELVASAESRVLLHGDLHHDNILRAARAPWLAIDPHGVVGDPGYEIGSLLFNPNPDDKDPALTGLVPARVEQLAAELAMPLDRVVAWGYVKAMLAEVWSTEDAEEGTLPRPGRPLDVARLLRPRLS